MNRLVAFGRRRLLAAAGAMFVCPPVAGCASGRSASTAEWAAVRSLLDRYVEERRYAGVTAALSYGDEPVAFLSAGKLAYDTAAPATPDSIFRLYSTTKPVTGVAAMMLVEDGRIALDQPVGEVLPELASMRVAIDPANALDSRPTTRPITMRQLITHTSGLSNWQPFLGDAPITRAYRERGLTPGNYGARRDRAGYGPQVVGLDALVRGLAEVPLIAEPGTAWNYSIGLDVMGAVVERVTGEGFDAFMRRRLFEPLEMASTGFQVSARDADRLTTLYESAEQGVQVVDEGRSSVWLQPSTLLAGGGGLVSTARDFIRFAAMLRAEGEYEGRRVMRRETVRLAMSNLLPPDLSYRPTGGFGAGAGVVMPGVVSENGPAGTYSAIGTSSTLVAVDPARRGIAVFLAQLMPPQVGASLGPAGASYRREFNAAVDADLDGRV